MRKAGGAVSAVRLDPDQLERLAEQVAARLAGPEPYVDKRGLAEHLQCSTRSIEAAMSEGMPHHIAFGRAKFRLTEVEPWLEEHGYLERRLDNRCENVTGSANGAAPRERPAPDHQGASLDGKHI